MRKRVLWSALIFCMLSAMSAICCKKAEKEPDKPVWEARTLYHTENLQAYALDEEGSLYTFELAGAEGEGTFSLNQYDKEGNRVFSKTLDSSLCSYTGAMAVKDGVLYFAPVGYSETERKSCAVLYAYNLDTEELTMLKEFPYFEKGVKRILTGEDRIYLIGSNTRSSVGGTDTYVYAGERVMYYIPSTGEMFALGIPEPIDIALDEEENLILYAHTEEGFCFLRYDAGQDAVVTIAETASYKRGSVALCNQGQDVLYQTERGLVLSSLSELEVQSEIYPDSLKFSTDNGLCCVGDRVACMTGNREVIQFSLAEVKKENKSIRYISLGYEMAEPYGCGYKMKRTKFDEKDMEKFAIKIMALDKDFDLCLVNTQDSFSYNLKKNGVFYPLNDVPGVQEYLDACFPYVREAATDENGTIWMLPIAVKIPGFVVNEEKMSGKQPGFQDDMTWQDYFAMQASLTEEERKMTGRPYVAYIRQFFRQYFAENTSVDTEQFREMLRLFSTCWKYMTEEEADDTISFLYQYTIGDDYHMQYLMQMGEDLRVYGAPKLSAGGAKNNGTCLFLAVNPYSDNLEATLDYISEWSIYTKNQKDTPLFFAERAIGEDPYERSVYELYRNAEIGFAMSEEIYGGYLEVLEDITKLEKYITETERKLKMYLYE